MRIKNIIYTLTATLAAMAATGCEDEKDLVIIEGNLPIKTSTLYMVGNATPNGWSIDNPTPLAASEADPLIFEWEGSLNSGEIKLCLTTGSWDAPFIRPIENGTTISKTDITDATFQMHAGDPDEKWRVTDAGIYRLSFNMRYWTMSTVYLRGQDGPVIEPINTDAFYIVGDATPNGWNIDAPTALTKTDTYIFEYDGPLSTGDFKACCSTGSWDVPFVRPSLSDATLGADGFSSPDFAYTTAPDDKWSVTQGGDYHLVFDLEHWTVSATFNGTTEPDKTPIDTPTLFMIGDATPGGWSMDDASEFTRSADNPYIFTWHGQLVEGSMKACTERDGTFSCPFLRPSSPDVAISASGVDAPDFIYTTGPDDQWRVTQAGEYTITFDLEHWTISAVADGGNDNPAPLETSTLYIIGDATPGGWSMDNLTAMTRSTDNQYIFIWEGHLNAGSMKACLQPDGTFSCPFLRPTFDGCKINATGVENTAIVYTTGPDDKWNIETADRYRLVFDLKNWTFTATSLN